MFGNWEKKFARLYHVEFYDAVFSYKCYVNCSFGVSYRHIMVVRKLLDLELFSVCDVLERWLRNYAESVASLEFYRETVDADRNGIPDEEVLDDNEQWNFMTEESQTLRI